MTEEIEATGSPMENQDIMTMIDFTADGDYTKATEIFNNMLMHRVDDALEQQKIGLADRTFNGASEDEDEQLEFDFGLSDDDEELEISDDEIDAMADELADDEDEED